ncbi:L-alanine-DL-glutamate epimerase-like enolase superfamily enzyme [Bradyrhizobium sp. RT11b]
MVKIKLDRSGGLTEGLAMARAAGQRGLEAMVDNMIGTSLAMAPAFLIGQLCSVVDLDGPALLKSDRAITVQYADGCITCPEALCGYPHEGGLE